MNNIEITTITRTNVDMFNNDVTEFYKTHLDYDIECHFSKNKDDYSVLLIARGKWCNGWGKDRAKYYININSK